MKKHKLIYLEWTDAISPIEGWQEELKILEWAKQGNYWVSQIGWILEENKKFIVLASQRNITIDESGSVTQFSHIIKIPKTWVRKRKELRV